MLMLVLFSFILFLSSQTIGTHVTVTREKKQMLCHSSYVIWLSFSSEVVSLQIQSSVAFISSLFTCQFPHEHNYKPWGILIPSNIATIEELQGIVAGLVSVVEDLTKNVFQVDQRVDNMAQLVPAVSQHSNTQSLHTLSTQLPSFSQDSSVQDNILEFLECYIQEISHLPAETCLSLLEQQCVGVWPRSVLPIAKITVIDDATSPKATFTEVKRDLKQNVQVK